MARSQHTDNPARRTAVAGVPRWAVRCVAAGVLLMVLAAVAALTLAVVMP